MINGDVEHNKLIKLLNYFKQEFKVECFLQLVSPASNIYTHYNHQNKTIFLNPENHTLEENCFILAHEFKHAIQYSQSHPFLIKESRVKKLQIHAIMGLNIILVILCAKLLTPLNFPLFLMGYIFMASLIEWFNPNYRLAIEKEADAFANQFIGGGAEVFSKNERIQAEFTNNWKKNHPYTFAHMKSKTHPTVGERHKESSFYPLRKEFLQSIFNNKQYDKV